MTTDDPDRRRDLDKVRSSCVRDLSDEVRDLSDEITSASLILPKTLLDELIFTAWYTQTAVVLTGLKGIEHRYTSDPSMLESDIHSGPHIIRRLERWATECPEDSVTRIFAEKYLPTVRGFYQSLLKYQASITESQHTE